MVDAVDGRLPAHRNKHSAYTGRVLAGSVSRSIVRGRTFFDGQTVPDPRCRAVLRSSASRPDLHNGLPPRRVVRQGSGAQS